MAIDIDHHIQKGLELKRAGGSGLQVSEMLDREGVPPDARTFILAQISKQELKARAEERSAIGLSVKGFLGAAMIFGGLAIAYKMFIGINGWSIISTVPFIIVGVGVKLLTSR